MGCRIRIFLASQTMHLFLAQWPIFIREEYSPMKIIDHSWWKSIPRKEELQHLSQADEGLGPRLASFPHGFQQTTGKMQLQKLPPPPSLSIRHVPSDNTGFVVQFLAWQMANEERSFCSTDPQRAWVMALQAADLVWDTVNQGAEDAEEARSLEGPSVTQSWETPTSFMEAPWCLSKAAVVCCLNKAS